MSEKLTLQERRLLYCHRNGHSNILHGCFGYMSCARCEQQIGDSLGGAYQNEKAVIVGHACKYCKANLPKLTTRDRALVPVKTLRQIARELRPAE